LLNELYKQKEYNDKLTKENNHLSYDLGEEKENNLILLKKIEKISNLYDDERKYNKRMNEKLREYEISANKNLNKITELYNEIEEKDKSIEKLKNKLLRFPFELSTGERLLSIIFTSSDRRILYSIICKNTDEFLKIEDELYEQFPEYKKYDSYFLHNGKKVNRFKTLENNRIYNNDIICLQII